nr:uncharacterized protein LOC119163834 isoform X2 [Rhipicephalus microplus]
MPLELNETLASVRLFLDPPIDIGLVRVVSKPQPNVVYYLLVDNSNGFPTAEKDDLEGNVWIYGGELSAKVRGVDIHSVTELCEVSIFRIKDNVDKMDLLPQTSGRAASSRQQVTTGKLSWRLILYATLPVMAVAAILAAVLFWKRKKVPCLRASYASGLHPAKRQGRRSLPLTPDDEEDSLGHVRHQRHGSSFPQPHLRPARMDPITQEQASSRLESPTSYPTWNLPTTCSKCLMNMPRWSLRPKGTPASRTEMSELQGKIATDPSFCVTLH